MPQSGKRATAAFVWWWVVGTSLWLALAATLARPDVVAAVAAGLLTALAASVRRRVGVLNYSLRIRWLRHLPRLVSQVGRDLVVLARALMHPSSVRSAFRAIPFDSGGVDPADVGRRGLLALAASLGPNTFVVAFDPDRRLLLVHQLVIDEQVLPLPNGKFPPP